MTRTIPILLLSVMTASSVQAGLVRETWGKKAVHSDTLAIKSEGANVRIVFDLSAIPKDATIHRALLRHEKIQQPAQPVRILVVDMLEGSTGVSPVTTGETPVLPKGKPLALLPPRYQWFDATEAVKRWTADPKSNLGFSLAKAEGFAPEGAFLDIWYDRPAGASAPASQPASVTGLKAINHDGQTFLTWDDLPMYRPESSEVVWAHFDKATNQKHPWQIMDGPGEGYMGKPRVAGVLQQTLRKIQRFEVVNSTTNSMSRERPKLIRKGAWPDVSYRVYRSREKVTPENIVKADWIGDSHPLCGFDQSMIRIVTWGEYYDPREDPEGFIPTFCLEDGKSLAPGRAFHVYTPTDEGPWYYAVTVAQDGVENFAVVAAQGSLDQPVAEKVAPLKPVLQFPRLAWNTVAYKYFLWDGPPLSNLAMQGINRMQVFVSPKHKDPGWLDLVRLAPASMHDDNQVMLGMDFGNGIGYSQGRGTFLSVAESKLDYYDERTWNRMIDWISQEWKIDPTHGVTAEGHYVPPMYGIRNPDRLAYLNTQATGLGFDWVWRGGACPLANSLGPRDSAKTVDGLPAWDVWHINWYIKRDPARDLPFCYWIEQQEGPEVSYLAAAAMRDAHQPFAAEWGGGHLASQLRNMLKSMRWDKPVPAFGNCSLDASPGSGWRPDGDPKGQINGFLIWDYATVTDSAEQWEMSVGLTADAPRADCTVDITPRHCKLFKPKAGQKFAWTNVNLRDGKEVQSGEVTADQWGLVTLKDAKVLKGAIEGGSAKAESRIKIVKKG